VSLPWLRSAAFAVAAVVWTVIAGVLFAPLLLLPRRVMQRAGALWCGGLLLLLRLICGIRTQVIGAENLPAGAAIIAAKHQSAWETLVFHRLLPDPVYILKRELLQVPLLGWNLWKCGNIPIDRSAGLSAIRTMLPRVEQALARGSQVIVFPEGTRVAPGERRPYQPGIAALYSRCAVPLIPVALNSGRLWGRRSFLKRPGVITIEILPPLPAGLERRQMLAELERRIEQATARLLEAESVDQHERTRNK
jgi:1-acyl-sn-glycerol-3-phosphate acyltransferase